MGDRFYQQQLEATGDCPGNRQPHRKKRASTTTPRLSKAASHDALAEAIKGAGIDVDRDIIDKLTGKAAQYFSSVITNIG